MKKLLIAMFALFLGLSTMAGAAASDEYNALDLGIWFGIPNSMEQANVRGLRIGFPISAGEGYVRGLELALFCAATDDIEGLQLSCVAMTDNLSGAQISLVNICNAEAKGTQIGIVNSAGKRGWQVGIFNSSTNAKFQLGIINMNKDGLWPFSFLINFGKDAFKSAETIRAEEDTKRAAKEAANKIKKK